VGGRSEEDCNQKARRETNRSIRNAPRIDTEALKALWETEDWELGRDGRVAEWQSGRVAEWQTYPNIRSQIRCTVSSRFAAAAAAAFTSLQVHCVYSRPDVDSPA
jgi:hypothetical protein